jgi:hypothetical protein
MTAVPLTVRRGVLHFTREAYERCFPTVQAVVLVRDGRDLLVLPVRHAAAGGYLVKLRNAAGDRAVDAADFLRGNGVEDSDERRLEGVWNEAAACLTAPAFFADN